MGSDGRDGGGHDQTATATGGDACGVVEGAGALCERDRKRVGEPGDGRQTFGEGGVGVGSHDSNPSQRRGPFDI